MANVSEKSPIGSLREVLSGPYYGMVWLGLANAAYTSEWKHDAASMTQDLKCAIQDPNFMPPLPEPGNSGKKDAPILEGSWSLDWGPAIASDWSNLIYIASYRSGPDQTGAPLFLLLASGERIPARVFKACSIRLSRTCAPSPVIHGLIILMMA